MDINKLRVNTELSVDGTWVKHGDTEFLIASLSGHKYLDAMSKHKASLAGGKTLDELEAKIALGAILSETILLGWKGLTENGKEVKYTKSKAKHYLTDPDYNEFRVLIMGLASDQEHFRYKDIEKKAKK